MLGEAQEELRRVTENLACVQEEKNALVRKCAETEGLLQKELDTSMLKIIEVVESTKKTIADAEELSSNYRSRNPEPTVSLTETFLPKPYRAPHCYPKYNPTLTLIQMKTHV